MPNQGYVRDRVAGTTTSVGVLPDGSVVSAGVTGMSPDGRYVTFGAHDPTTNNWGLYVRDAVSGTTKFIAPDLYVSRTAMTGAGEIAFVSSSSTLVPGDTNGYPDVFVANIATGAIARVNFTNGGQQESGNTIGLGNDNAAVPAISRDGRFVAFWSASANMGVAANHTAVFLRDRVAGTTELVSIIPTTLPYCFSQREGVSNDGRYVSFSAALRGRVDHSPVVGDDGPRPAAGHDDPGRRAPGRDSRERRPRHAAALRHERRRQVGRLLVERHRPHLHGHEQHPGRLHSQDQLSS